MTNGEDVGVDIQVGDTMGRIRRSFYKSNAAELRNCCPPSQKYCDPWMCSSGTARTTFNTGRAEG
jgi:hypothetical protein